MTGSWRRAALFAGPPGAWVVHLLLSYLLVAPTCGGSTLPLHAATVGLAAVAVGSIAVGARAYEGNRPVALVFGGLFVLAIALQGLASAAVDPCA